MNSISPFTKYFLQRKSRPMFLADGVTSPSGSAPLRSEILTREALAQYARGLAEEHQIVMERGGRALLARFQENVRFVEAAYYSLADSAKNEEQLTPGAEWLLDNYHIVEEHVRDIRRHLPRAFYRLLPKLSSGPYKGYPRVYHLALQVLTHTDAVITKEILNSVVQAYQEKATLTIGELWAFPIMLRLALIENLRRLTEANVKARDQRLVGNELIQSLVEAGECTASVLLMNLAAQVKGKPYLVDHCAVHLMRYLRSAGSKAALTQHWLEERIRESGKDPHVLLDSEDQAEALNQISIGNTVTSLKTVSALNWRSWVEAVSYVHKALSKDPTAVFQQGDFDTRNRCRTVIEHLARTTGQEELLVAEAAVRCVEQLQKEGNPRASIPFVLIAEGRQTLETKLGYHAPFFLRSKRALAERAFPVYIGSLCLTTILILFGALYSGHGYGASPGILAVIFLVFLVPASDLATSLVQWLITRLTTPQKLPKLDLETGIPDAFQTIVVIHQIFHDPTSIAGVIDALEVRYLANDQENIYYAVLADLPDASEPVTALDQELISHAEKLVAQLNQKYANGTDRFLLLFRSRRWNERDAVYMGWERKRGKLEEFNRLILGDDTTSFTLHAGTIEQIRRTRYVITLDGDTQLTRGVALRMIETAAHPLNQPVFDDRAQIITKGYGIIQPRIGISLQSAHSSQFARICSGQSGFDPYTNTISDVYQDLFSEGSYLGKAIYDVSAFARALHNRVPENTLLSHDLFEGLFARVGLATDIELIDDFPAKFNVYAKRQHRWVRGDWQLLPFLFSQIPSSTGAKGPSPITSLGRWKLLDNLRRSLVAPLSLLMLFVSWTLLPGPAWLWSLFVVAVIAFPVYANLANALLLPPLGLSLGLYVRGLGRDLLKQSQQAIYTLSFLPYLAFLMLHAISLTLYRVYISKKDLLEWETASQSERRLDPGIAAFLLQMLPGTVITVLIGLSLFFFAPHSLLVASPFLGLWLIGPVLASQISQPTPENSILLGDQDREYLNFIGYETWAYFDDFLIDEYHYLIPDNIQLVPKMAVARRTSPTNIGLSILSVIAAHDLGFIALPGALKRLSKTTESMLKLERYNGHFLNWYDIVDLRALHPRYVSSVDSGNLVGHLVAASAALRNARFSALIHTGHWANIRQLAKRVLTAELPLPPALQTFLEDIRKSSSAPPSTFEDLCNFLLQISDFHSLLSQKEFSRERLPKTSHELLDTLDRTLREIAQLHVFLDWYFGLDEMLSRIQSLQLPTSEEQRSAITRRIESLRRILTGRLPTWALLRKIDNRIADLVPQIQNQYAGALPEDFRAELIALQSKVQASSEALAQLRGQLSQLLSGFTGIISECNFEFLYNREKKLLAIGYDVDNARPDSSFYDLLASESRLASFIAIAKGEVPQEHWFMLGRSLADSPGGKALLSWSATMFEYLMPLLVMKDFPESILSHTDRAVVKAQRLYGKKRGVPWGISESAYSGVDFEKTYQYRAFGVPGLGLKRGLTEDLVISPYSTFLALPIDPHHAIQNIHRLQHLGLRGKYGFYEAIDFTSARLSGDEPFHIIESFLAHHQGMTLISLANVLRKNIFQRRFHSDPRVRATELLLQERFPHRVPAVVPNQAELSLVEHQEEDHEFRAKKSELHGTPHTDTPRTRLISNGRYSVMLNNAGSGWSFFENNISLTRWRSDSITNDLGYYIFVRDLDTNKVWSVTYQPTCVEPDSYEVVYNPDKIEFKRRDFGIVLHTEITVSPEDNVEIRRITISNVSNRKRNIEVTSFAEVALGATNADKAHPAFAKMFVESAYDADRDCLLFSRRRRSVHEPELFLMHMITMPIVWGRHYYETSRANFIGRGRTVHNPQVFKEKRFSLPGTTGHILDPIYSLRTRLELSPVSSEEVTFITAVGRSREEMHDVAERYNESHVVSRAFEMAWSRSNVELRHEQFSIAQTHAFQHLANALFYNIPELRAPSEIIANNRLTQAGFWRFGVSGDYPMVVLRVRDKEHLKLVREITLAHYYLRLRGLEFDVIVINEYPGGYFQDFHLEIQSILESGFSSPFVEKNGGLFLRNIHNLAPEDLTLLQSHARVIIDGENGPLSSQLTLPTETTLPIPEKSTGKDSTKQSDELTFECPKEDLEYFNGLGGFAEDGTQYSIHIRRGKVPPLPWANIIANKTFGFLITESGSGYSWCENSRENRLTPWSNDPVSDPCGEALYIRDSQTGLFWSPTPQPVTTDTDFLVKHAFGYSTFHTQVLGIHSALTVTGGPTENAKWWELELTNGDYLPHSLEVFLYVDWTLGILRDDAASHVVTEYRPEDQTLFARNEYNNEFAHKVAYITSHLAPTGYTGSRLEFIGPNRSLGSPHCLSNSKAGGPRNFIPGFSAKRAGVELSGTTGAGVDPCGVLKVQVELRPGEKRRVLFCMGEESSFDEALVRAREYRSPRRYEEALTSQKAYWKSVLSPLQVRTPNRSMDLMLNGWLLYQNLSCRMNGRSAFYQSSGAYGFRDQLQDSMSLLFSTPDHTREQILLHASRQFFEGDVQHWWHPPTGRGVRTRISDDYLWLPYVVDEYIKATGDTTIFEAPVPFLEGHGLEPEQMEAYIVPEQSAHTGTLYEHCIISIDRALRYGVHGLPFIGGGDWNDGMNEVGSGGKGESVWLGWFIYDILNRFTPIVASKNDKHRAAYYKKHATDLLVAIEQNGWDGEWYLRAFFDDGTPLGSKDNDECQIDSLSQSWGVITGGGDPERTQMAMAHVYSKLVDEKGQLIRLLTPPFDRGTLEPGYIKGYLPGIRENGGQYTHAAAWVIMATAMLGRGNKAAQLFDLVNPINHMLNPDGVKTYQGEPYVTCGDVYSTAPHIGRAGWSWYTGSASWLYRVGIENILGLRLRAAEFIVDPCIPSAWDNYSLEYTVRGVHYSITVNNPDHVESGVKEVRVDGKPLKGLAIPILPEATDQVKTVTVDVLLGPKAI